MPQTLKLEFEEYLQHAFPGILDEGEPDPRAYAYSRHELGGDLPNGTEERVVQATSRAVDIFGATFPGPGSLWVLAYEYPEPQLFTGTPDYLQALLEEAGGPIYKAQETTDGETVVIYISRFDPRSAAAPAILRAIANNEMGFEPSLNQRIYFFDPAADRGFMMYDDRGCFVWTAA